MNLVSGEEIAPGIVLYDNVIDNCQEIINFAIQQNFIWADSKVGEGAETIKGIRNGKTFSPESYFSVDSVWFNVAKIIWSYANDYGIKNDAPFSSMEQIQMLYYQPSSGFYRTHSDSGPGMQRIFSAVLYLNDVDEGGETYFNKFDISIKPRAGRLAIFPANYVYTHEARRSPKQEKYVIVTWFQPLF